MKNNRIVQFFRVFVLVVLAGMCFKTTDIYAESQAKIGFVVAVDSNGDATAASPAIAVSTKSGAYIYTDGSCEDFNYYYSDSGKYEIQFDSVAVSYTDGTSALLGYVTTDTSISNDSTCYEYVAAPVACTDYTTVCYTSDANGYEYKNINFDQYQDLGNGYAYLAGEMSEEASTWPGAVVDENGSLIAVMLESDGTSYCEWFDEETFRSGASDDSSSGENDSTEDGSSENEDPGNDQTDEDVVGAAPKSVISDFHVDGTLTENKSKNYIWIGLAAIIAVTVIIVVILVMKSRKKKISSYGYTIPAGGNNAPIKGVAGTMTSDDTVIDSVEAGRGHDTELEVQLFLRGEGGHMNARVYPITENPITIGRLNNCVIRYPQNAPNVSRNHAQLYVENGRIMLIDTSSFGTFLPEIGKIAPKSPIELREGDVFYIGTKNNGFRIVRG